MKITTINTIETSSLCNNQCEYCPAPIQGKHRETGLMDWATFKEAITWVMHFCKQRTQMELNLFGVGEPTLHPDIAEMVEYARKHLPIRQKIHLNTNGNTMTFELATKLKKSGITSIDITGHNARSVAQTIRYFRQVGIPGQISMDFMTRPNDWAGQVDWFKPDYYKVDGMDCPWLGKGQAMVMSNGDITACCIDAFASGVFTHVAEDITQKQLQPFQLCHSCHHTIPESEMLIKVA
jgi:hypothetical protein